MRKYITGKVFKINFIVMIQMLIFTTFSFLFDIIDT